ncbi:hypothetical protein HID58_043027, partial [Brassica napus]
YIQPSSSSHSPDLTSLLEAEVSEFTKKKSGAKLMVFSLVLGLVLLIVLGELLPFIFSSLICITNIESEYLERIQRIGAYVLCFFNELMNSIAFHLLNCSDLIAINRVEGLLKPSVSLVECHRETIKTMANQRNFSKLLFSQIPVDLDSPEPFWFGSQGPDESPVMSAPDVPAKPPGVKAAKASTKKKKSGREEELSRLHGVLEIKEKLSKQKLLDRLLAMKEPLLDIENSLMLKLMSEMI